VCIGDFVGVFVGSLLGVAVGLLVGCLEGECVGVRVGNLVGAFVTGAFIGTGSPCRAAIKVHTLGQPILIILVKTTSYSCTNKVLSSLYSATTDDSSTGPLGHSGSCGFVGGKVSLNSGGNVSLNSGGKVSSSKPSGKRQLTNPVVALSMCDDKSSKSPMSTCNMKCPRDPSLGLSTPRQKN
jgi:hypothetical protein